VATNIPVSFKIGTQEVARETITGSLAAEVDTVYTFTTYYGDFAGAGDYAITASTHLANDEDISNDATATTVHSYGTFEITQFPYTQTFENSDATRVFWKQEIVSFFEVPLYWTYMNGTSAWPGVQYIPAAHGGALNAAVTTYTGVSVEQSTHSYRTRLVSPRIYLNSLEAPLLKFYHAQPSAHALGLDTLSVYYKNSEAGEWHLLYKEERVLTSWTETVLVLPNKTNDYYIAFECSTGIGYDVALDDITIENAALADAKMVEILTPHTGIDMRYEDVTVKIQNFSAIPLIKIPVKYEVNGLWKCTDTIYTTLNTFEEFEHTFSIPADLRNERSYEISAYVDYPSDGNHGNDTVKITIQNYVGKAIMGLVNNVTTCSTAFYDNGVTENYKPAPLTERMVFYPGEAGKRINANFTLFDLFPQEIMDGYVFEGDSLIVYDGDTSDPQRRLAGLSGTITTALNFRSTSTNGALTFVFRKLSANGVSYTKAGWVADITCVEPVLNDIGVKEIVTPTNPLREANTATQISVKLQNYGDNDLTGFDVAYKLNNNAEVTQTYTQTLAAGAIADFTFTQTLDLSAFSEDYNLQVYTKLTNDANVANDTANKRYFYRQNVELHGFRMWDFANQLQYGGNNAAQYNNLTYRHISFGSNTPNTVSAAVAYDFQTNGIIVSGCYGNDVIYAFTVDIQSHEPKYFLKLDTNFNVLSRTNSNNLDEVGQPYFPSDLTYDYSTGKLYGIFTNVIPAYERVTPYLLDIDTTTGVAQQMELQYIVSCVAANTAGNLYGISDNGYFVSVNKNTGAVVPISETGVPTVMEIQSIAFDHRTGRLFWAVSSGSIGNLYEISPTGVISDFGKINQGAEVSALYTTYNPLPPLKVENPQNDDFTTLVYPSLTDGIVYVKTNSAAEIRLCDITGRTLETHNSTGNYELNLASRLQGVYIVVVASADKTTVTRVIRK
jgi:hypothetical protein